jgi:hypothetical protein
MRLRVLSVMTMVVRRDSAVKLVDDLTGESPVSADYPVGTVVISGDGTGDQAVGSPDVKRPRWLDVSLVCSDRRASKATGRSASEPWLSREKHCLTRIGV